MTEERREEVIVCFSVVEEVVEEMEELRVLGVCFSDVDVDEVVDFEEDLRWRNLGRRERVPVVF